MCVCVFQTMFLCCVCLGTQCMDHLKSYSLSFVLKMMHNQCHKHVMVHNQAALFTACPFYLMEQLIIFSQTESGEFDDLDVIKELACRNFLWWTVLWCLTGFADIICSLQWCEYWKAECPCACISPPPNPHPPSLSLGGTLSVAVSRLI